MSDLQLALLALGAAIIAGVILFNWWQERRFLRESVRRFEGPADDALMEEFRIDPEKIAVLENEAVTIGERLEGLTAADDEMAEDLRPAAGEEEILPAELEPPAAVAQPEAELSQKENAAPAQEAVAAPAAAADFLANTGALPAGIDAEADLVALLHPDAPLAAAALNRSLSLLPNFDKAVRWFGRNEAGGWQPLTPGQENAGVTCLACALQLADRSGPISQETLHRFQDRMGELAASLGAALEWHGSADPLRHAAELDQFCAEVDVTVGCHIIQDSSGPFAGTKLRGLAEAGGMKLHEDGAFHYENDAGETLFRLISQDQRPFRPETLRTVFYRGISFRLDVSRVRNCTEAFNQMALLARQMESSLDGKLVDDNQRPLGETELDKIRQQLKMIHARMVARGIIPGSPTALRLFA